MRIRHLYFFSVPVEIMIYIPLYWQNKVIRDTWFSSTSCIFPHYVQYPPSSPSVYIPGVMTFVLIFPLFDFMHVETNLYLFSAGLKGEREKSGMMNGVT